MTAITGADSIAILKQGSTYGTAVQGGTGDKIVIEDFTPSRSTTEGTTNSIGSGLTMSVPTEITNVEDTFSISQQARYDDGGLGRVLALFMGASGSPTEQNVGEGDYLHTITHNATADKFATFAIKTTDAGVIEYPSAHVTSLTINSGTTPNYLTYSADFLAHSRKTSSTTNTTVSLGNSTLLGDTRIVHNSISLDNASENYIWLNTYADGALDSADEICASEFSITLSKPREIIQTFCTKISRKTGYLEASVTLTFPRLVDHTFFTAHEAGTLYKMSINTQGAQIGAGDDFRFTSLFPYLKVIESPDFSISDAGENGHTVTFKGFVAPSTPTGMSSVYPYFELLNDNSSAILS